MDIKCTDCGQPIEVSLLCGECSAKSDRLLVNVSQRNNVLLLEVSELRKVIHLLQSERDALKKDTQYLTGELIGLKDRLTKHKTTNEHLRKQCNAEFQVQGEGKE